MVYLTDVSLDKMVLDIGDRIPDVEVVNQDDEPVNLAKLVIEGKKKLVVYFYPKDNTPGCTKEACSFRDEYQSFGDENILVFGVSKDSTASHIKFRTKYDLPFPLLSDPSLELAKAYGAYGKTRSGKMGTIRSTFVFDEEGKLVALFGLRDHPKVTTATHATEVLEVIRA